MSRTIEIIIAPDGQTRVATVGFRGPACLEASKSLEAALGQRRSDELTKDFHETPLVIASPSQLQQRP